MHRSTLFVLICVLMITSAIIVNLLGERVELGRAIPLQITAFPKEVGSWRDVADLPVQPELPDALPTAQVVERDYVNQYNQGVDLLLLTATDYGDLHDPQACFPSQGWALSNPQQVDIGGERVTDMSASLGDQHEYVIYWRPDFYHVPVPQTIIARRVYYWYIKHVRPDDGHSLLVRVIGQDTPDGRAAVLGFTNEIMGPLKQLHYQKTTD